MLIPLLLIATLYLVTPFAGAKPYIINYPNIDGVGSQSIGYAALQMIIEKEQVNAKVVLSPRVVNQQRARLLVESGKLSVFDTGYKTDLEDRFTAIYAPIDRGLLGWRLFITNQNGQQKLDALASLAREKTNDEKMAFLQKASLTAGQGDGWGDIPLLEKAGMKVITASTIQRLVKMVDKGRFDVFPLGSNETYAFLEQYDTDIHGRKLMNVSVDDKVVFVYPYGRILYVQKGNTELANLIKNGLEKALHSGNLQKLLETHAQFKDAFTRAKLKERVRFDVTPDEGYLTQSFLAIDPKWWYDPTQS